MLRHRLTQPGIHFRLTHTCRQSALVFGTGSSVLSPEPVAQQGGNASGFPDRHIPSIPAPEDPPNRPNGGNVYICSIGPASRCLSS